MAGLIQKLKQKKIDRRDLALAIMAFIIIAMAFFGWYYFKAGRNPLDTVTLPGAPEYRYLLSVYDPKRLKRPLGVAVNSWGDIYIADSANHRLVVFDQNGRFKKTLGGPGTGEGRFYYPAGVAVSGNKVYVADFYNQRVQVLDQDGNFLAVLPSPRDRNKLGPVIMPITVATDSKGNLYVSDLSKQRILVFDEKGSFQYSFGKGGSGRGELSYVNGIAVDDAGKGRIYLANSNNGRIDVYSMKGEYISTLAGSKSLLNPKGIAFDRDSGNLLVADTFAHRIAVFNEEGNVVQTVGTRGIEPGGFNFPTAVTVDDEGRMYVADRENNRVEVYVK